MPDAVPPRPRLSVVIPVYNERATIERVLHLVQATDVDKEIIVIDDGSHDGTREWLAELARTIEQTGGTREVMLPTVGAPLRTHNIRVILHERNQGKGAAVRSGFQVARGRIVIIQDADLEYDPKDYLPLMMPIEEGRADIVFGSRFHGGPHRVMYFWHYVGNKVLTVCSNMLTNLNLTDMWAGFKAFRREVIEELELTDNGFGVEVEMTAKLARTNWRIYEVPIAYYGRTYEEGKKITWRDGVRALGKLVRYNLLTPSPQPKRGLHTHVDTHAAR
ncbi:MAG: glycosyltransferase family 2 protein [Candidatus Omnitrophica bacterium]|nr:glycosyltransferase family 2 protein [Candidatus Omnitrophota bacterium]